MRLKLIFFPIVLIVSVTIFINNIWPQIGEVKKINAEKISKRADLEAVAIKQEIINKTNQRIIDGGELSGNVKKYLTEKKNEENIISSVSFLAGDANLTLTNISLSAAAPSVAAIDPATGQPIVEKLDQVKNIPVKISVNGEYDKIRRFLDGVEHMPIFSKIKTIKITKQKAEKKEGEEQQTNSLVAEIDVDFGYMGPAVVDGNAAAKFNPELDTETMEALKQYISQKSQFVENPNEQKGKTNPFFAN